MSDKANPGLALLIGVGVLLALALILWPKKGLFSLWRRSWLVTQRVLLEDALKFLFDCEYKNLLCGLNTIAGHLNISSDKATKLLDRLTSMGLISLDKDTIRLTDEGCSYALRIIRVHRVWEKYLADETGIRQAEWHGAADQKEHYLSIEEADRLAMQIGNPVFDPHGDPIPSSKGEIPAHTGKPLSSLKEGDIATLVHIEDEPHSIYAQLMALGLYPGMQIYVLDIADGKMRFAANGDECTLTSLFASNITVKLIPQIVVQEKSDVLSSLKLGEKAEVKGISPYCRGQQRRRLMDLGIIPGTMVTAELKSATGDPIAYKVLGANIAIRKNQADHIFIKRLTPEQ
jgi:DtxR family Mn-dependent transcriptional regulator